MSVVRLKRLRSDFDRLSAYVRHHPRLRLIQTQGDPPDRYQIEYQIRSMRQRDGELIGAETHLVEIYLPAGYPRMAPHCRMLTPVFHPNIAPHAICIGDHWSAGESLSSLVGRIGEMLAYQSYNTKSPLNGEASRWTDQNIEKLPLDSVNMMIDDAEHTSGDPAPASAATTATQTAVAPAVRIEAPPAPKPAPLTPPPPAAAPPEPIIVSCPSCEAKMRLKPEFIGKRLRCPRCKTLFEGTAGT